MQDQEARLKALRGEAQRKVDEICRLTLDSNQPSDRSLTNILVQATRAGMPTEKAGEVFDALNALIKDAFDTYRAAIAQPEPRISAKSRVVL